MLQFGEYAAYVWPAYGLTAGIMVGLVVLSVSRLKRQQRALKGYEQAGFGQRRSRRSDAEESE